MSEEENYLKKELYDLVKKDSSVFEFLQSGSLDGVWFWDLEKPENEWMSPRFWTNFGYDPADKKHLSGEWQNMIFKEDLKTATDNFTKHCSDPDYPYDQIVRYVKKDGSTAWVRCRGIAIRDENGKPLRMLGAHNDVTLIKKAEQDLKDKIEELEKLNAFSINRELKMIELKNEIEELKVKLQNKA